MCIRDRVLAHPHAAALHELDRRERHERRERGGREVAYVGDVAAACYLTTIEESALFFIKELDGLFQLERAVFIKPLKNSFG